MSKTYGQTNCVVCGCVFIKSAPTQKVCKNKDCIDIHRRKLEKIKYYEHKEKYTRVCKSCGLEFTTTDSKRMYCGSIDCECNRKRTNSIAVEEKRLGTRNEEKKKYYREVIYPDREVKDGPGANRLSYSFVKDCVESRGYKLVSDTYTSNRDKLDLTCIKEHKWSVTFHSFKDNLCNCPRCVHMEGSSKPEREIRDFVISLIGEENVLSNVRDVISPFELDIFAPAQKVAIEFCGLYWHSEVGGNKSRKYHYEKMVACNEKGIRLLVIFEDEYTNRKEVVLSRIQNAIGVGLKKVYARKCEIREIDTKTANAFLMEFHLQGKSNSTKRWGLFYEGLLVAVLSSGYPARAHTSGGKRVLEIKRFASRSGYSIVGGASKLFSTAKKFAIEQDFEIIKSYCDRRYESLIPVYEQLGFTLQTYTKYTPHYLSPDYKVRVRNQGLRKTPEERTTGLSEWELRKAQGYDRIFDCGHKTYILKLK